MVTAFDHYCLSDQTSDAETPDATRARRFANAPLASIVAMVGRGERRVEGKVRSITVVIPTHNRPKLLAEAVRSVLRSPLIESPSQVVIVDNDGLDQSAKALADAFGTRYARVACAGPSGTRNAGLALAPTEFVTFLDDDDLWMPGAHEAQLEALTADPTAAFAYGQWQAASWDLSERMSPSGAPPSGVDTTPEHFFHRYHHISTVLFRRDALAEVGGFDESLIRYEDLDILQRVNARHPAVAVEAVTLICRQRPPGRQRCDERWHAGYLMGHRPPKGLRLRVGPTAVLKDIIRTRGHIAGGFLNDADACGKACFRHDTLVCLSRAFFLSPPAMLRRPSFWRLLLGSLKLRPKLDRPSR